MNYLMQVLKYLMKKLINHNESIFIAGGAGMVGKAINKVLIKAGYGSKNSRGKIFSPSRKELDLSDYSSLEKWFKKNRPSVVIIAAARVGGG